MRWHDNPGTGLLGQHGIGHWLTIVGTIAHENLERSVNLGQKIRHGSGVTHFGGGELARQNLVVFIHRQMKLASR